MLRLSNHKLAILLNVPCPNDAMTTGERLLITWKRTPAQKLKTISLMCEGVAVVLRIYISHICSLSLLAGGKFLFTTC